MPDVYHLTAGSGRGIVADSFEGAMRHVDAMMRYRLDQPGDGGSLAQRIRYAARERFDELTVARHDTAATPGTPSLVETFDLLDGADPAFAVLAAFWDFAKEDVALEDARSALLADYAAALQAGRRFREDDATLVARLRATDAAMGGECLVPLGNDPAAVLERLPEVVADLFAEMAVRFFPDVAPSPAGPR